jgi:hypothetical protein
LAIVATACGGVAGAFPCEDLNTDVCSESNRLAATYGGKIQHVWGSALHGFALNVADRWAPWIAADLSVCYVEQDQVGHGAAGRQADP